MSTSPAYPSSPKRAGKAPAVGAPIDYSFRDLKQTTDVLYEQPQSGITAHPAIGRDVSPQEYLEGLASGVKIKVKSNSQAVRLCNNQLTSLKGLDTVMPHLLTKPSELTWLDVSCNQLTGIEDVVTQFPNVQVLYMHGNMIKNFHDVHLLAKLEHLQKLTLHGNPVSEHPQYKLWVCAHLPQLRSLDFSTITKLDRDKVDVWNRGHQKHSPEK